MSLIAAHDVLGFAIYTGKTAELNVWNNANTIINSFEMGDMNLPELLSLANGEVSPDDPERIQLLNILNSHLIRITKEEYYSL
jgi:hypothetical protein